MCVSFRMTGRDKTAAEPSKFIIFISKKKKNTSKNSARHLFQQQFSIYLIFAADNYLLNVHYHLSACRDVIGQPICLIGDTQYGVALGLLGKHIVRFVRRLLLYPINVFTDANESWWSFAGTIIPDAAEWHDTSQHRFSRSTNNKRWALSTTAHIEFLVVGTEEVVNDAIQMRVDLLAFGCAQDVLDAMLKALGHRSILGFKCESGDETDIALSR